MTRFRLILSFYFICAGIIAVQIETDIDSAEETLNFVNQLQNSINWSDNPNITLVMGNTGCGKSTFVHYVTGDCSKLIAEEHPNAIELVIRDYLDPDKGKITTATESRALRPYVAIDEEQYVWIDCPGFADTRSAFLIRRVIENAENIRIALLLDFASVTNSRTDFDDLLTQVTQLIRNVSRFENSVSLVVTKAASFKLRSRKSIEIFEDSVKNVTGKFMNDHRVFLEKKGSNNDNKIQLINALLKRSPNGDYPRISVFWRPDEAGPFNQSDKMVAGRRSIRDSIINHTTYTKTESNDFSFPLTAEAQIKVQKMAQHSTDNIFNLLPQIKDQLIYEIEQQIKSTTLWEKGELVEYGEKCIRSLGKGHANQLLEQFSELIRVYYISSIDMTKFERIKGHQRNLNTLSSLTQENSSNANTNTKSKGYDSFLKEITDFFAGFETETRNEIENKANAATRTISEILSKVDSKLLVALQKKIESIDDFQKKLEFLTIGQNILPAKTVVSLEQRVQTLINLTYAYDIGSIDVKELYHIAHHEKALVMLKSIPGSEVQIPIHEWMANSAKAINYQDSAYDWYSFLAQTIEFAADYDIQKEFNANRQKKITKNNFVEFTKRIRFNAEYVPTPTKVAEINDIMDFILAPPQYECNAENMTIKGNFVKSSDIQLTKCPSSADLKWIKVFVVYTFYVDCNLYLNKTKAVTLEIFAKIWNIRKEATFYLNGVDGAEHPQLLSSGTAGKRGNPGGNAGHFIGWANKVVNYEWLTVNTTGGRGGNGQDGTGSPDVYVTFYRTWLEEDEKANFDPDSYYRRYFRENGYDAELMKSRKQFGRTQCKDASKIRFWQDFRLYSDSCCGSTGVGGGGKK